MAITRFANRKKKTPSTTIVDKGKKNLKSRELISLASTYAGGRTKTISPFLICKTRTRARVSDMIAVEKNNTNNTSIFCKPCAKVLLPSFDDAEKVYDDSEQVDDDEEIQSGQPCRNNVFNIILNENNLKTAIEENCLCKQCVIRGLNNMQVAYKESNYKFAKELKSEITFSFPKNTPKMNKKKERLHKMIDTNLFKQQTILNERFVNLLDCELTMCSSNVGLATTLTGVCKNRRQRKIKRHMWKVQPSKTDYLGRQSNSSSRHHINILAVLASHQVGIGYFHLTRFFAFLGINGLHQHAYRACEDILGKYLILSAEETMHEAREEEKKAVLEQDYKRHYTHSEWGFLVLMIVAVDMGWNKRASGRLYDSPSGVTHMLGVIFQKILLSTVMVRICFVCDSLRYATAAVEELVKKTKHTFSTCVIMDCEICEEMKQKKEKLDEMILNHSTHTCKRNCGDTDKGISAKGMEPLGTCELVNEAPKYGMKIHGICMDDDQSTRAQLRFDDGPESTGRMTRELEVTNFFADPSHRKKTYNNGLYKMFSNPIAKRLGKYFSCWVSQMKKESKKEMHRLRKVPVLHAQGNHSLCCETGNDWCLASRAKKEGKSYNKKPIFDVNNKKHKKRIIQHEEYHMKMVSEKKQAEMRHNFNTQTNESLNMRAAEFAPKHKNFSRSSSLKYRIQNVIGTHNSGYLKFYIKLLEKMNIPVNIIIYEWLKTKDGSKQKAKEASNKQSNKRKRAWKRKAKSKEELFIEQTRGPKDGTYGRCIGMEVGNPSKKQKSSARKNCVCGAKVAHKNKSSKHCLF